MKFIPIVLMTLTLSGCASIMGDKTQALPIDIQPEGTKITVKDNTGMTVYTGTSPTTVTLNKSDGSYFGKKNYTIFAENDGYSSQSIPITESVNGWYIGGNIVFGGLIGWLIVDPWNGGMYKLDMDKIQTKLYKPDETPTAPLKIGSAPAPKTARASSFH